MNTNYSNLIIFFITITSITALVLAIVAFKKEKTKDTFAKKEYDLTEPQKVRKRAIEKTYEKHKLAGHLLTCDAPGCYVEGGSCNTIYNPWHLSPDHPENANNRCCGFNPADFYPRGCYNFWDGVTRAAPENWGEFGYYNYCNDGQPNSCGQTVKGGTKNLIRRPIVHLDKDGNDILECRASPFFQDTITDGRPTASCNYPDGGAYPIENNAGASEQFSTGCGDPLVNASGTMVMQTTDSIMNTNEDWCMPPTLASDYPVNPGGLETGNGCTCNGQCASNVCLPIYKQDGSGDSLYGKYGRCAGATGGHRLAVDGKYADLVPIAVCAQFPPKDNETYLDLFAGHTRPWKVNVDCNDTGDCDGVYQNTGASGGTFMRVPQWDGTSTHPRIPAGYQRKYGPDNIPAPIFSAGPPHCWNQEAYDAFLREHPRYAVDLEKRFWVCTGTQTEYEKWLYGIKSKCDANDDAGDLYGVNDADSAMRCAMFKSSQGHADWCQTGEIYVPNSERRPPNGTPAPWPGGSLLAPTKFVWNDQWAGVDVADFPGAVGQPPPGKCQIGYNLGTDGQGGVWPDDAIPKLLEHRIAKGPSMTPDPTPFTPANCAIVPDSGSNLPDGDKFVNVDPMGSIYGIIPRITAGKDMGGIIEANPSPSYCDGTTCSSISD